VTEARAKQTGIADGTLTQPIGSDKSHGVRPTRLSIAHYDKCILLGRSKDIVAAARSPPTALKEDPIP